MRSTRTGILATAVFVLAVLSACAQPAADQPGSAGAPGGDSPVSASSRSADPAAATNRGIVTGRVVNADGAPVVGVQVRPRSLDDPARPIPELVVATDDKGVFQWTLEPGRYEFQAQPSGTASGRTEPRTATVTVGRTETLDLTLR